MAENNEINNDEIKNTNDENITKSDVNENNDDGIKKDKFCFVCRRPENTAGKLVTLPMGMNICIDCMQRTLDTMGNMPLDEMNFGNLPFGIKTFNFADFSENFYNNNDNEKGDENQKENEKEVSQSKSSKKNEDKKNTFDLEKLPLPHIIKQGLDEYVIGQDFAKKVISVAVYNHYKRISSKNDNEVDIEKSNILLLGPTGSGKTYLVQTLARLLNVPLAIADATSLTEAGYIGDDIESVLSKLLSEAKGDVKRAESGIVFVDEIDKLAKKKNAHQRDVSGESVQQGMLKLLEGAKIEVPVGASSKNAMVPLTTMSTKNILFICGGAFPGIDNIIKERLNKQSSMGFLADLKDKYDDEEDILKYVTSDDVRKYGMIPEFIGRLPIISHLSELSKENLIQILKEPKNAILKQYKKLLEMDEVELRFSDDALEAIAQKAIKRKTGARALRSIIEEFMLDIMYEIPKDDNIGRVAITADYINGKASPVIEMRTVGRIEAN